jgi:hypothetical protein
MTLNDNPRVAAEKRFYMLIKRRDKVMYLTNHSFNSSALFLNPNRKRGSVLVGQINKELTQIGAFLKTFK